LTPDDGLGIGVCIEVLLQLLPWEGVQLLNTGDGSVLEAVVGTMLVKRCVDLTRAKDDAINVLGLLDCFAVFGVGDDPSELRVAGELFDRGSRNGVAKEGLGEEKNESYRKMLVMRMFSLMCVTYVFGIVCSFVSSKCGTSSQGMSCTQSGGWHLGVDDQVLPRTGR